MSTSEKMLAHYRIQLALKLKPKITVGEIAQIIKEIKNGKAT